MGKPRWKEPFGVDQFGEHTLGRLLSKAAPSDPRQPQQHRRKIPVSEFQDRIAFLASDAINRVAGTAVPVYGRG